MWLIGGENNLHTSTQKMDTFNNFCDVACLKFKMPRDNRSGYLRTIHFFEGNNATLIKYMS